MGAAIQQLTSWNWVSLTWPGWYSTMPILAGEGRCKLHPNHPQRKTQREKEGWTINVSVPSQHAVLRILGTFTSQDHILGCWAVALWGALRLRCVWGYGLGVLLAVVKGAALDTPRGSLYFWYFLFWMTLGSSHQIPLKSHWDLIRVALALWVNWGELTFYVLFLTLKHVISSLYWRLL